MTEVSVAWTLPLARLLSTPTKSSRTTEDRAHVEAVVASVVMAGAPNAGALRAAANVKEVMGAGVSADLTLRGKALKVLEELALIPHGRHLASGGEDFFV